MRILITGAGGQVGRELLDVFSDYELCGTDHRALDITDRSAVLELVTSFRPNAIVHAAAWTAVDACEQDPDRAFAVNALGTRHLAESARRVGAHLTAFSTDYVFDGTKAEPYVEWDTPNPQSVYGRSKLAGERELAAVPDSATIRISWVCGLHGQNMVKTILRLATEHDTLRFVDDQRGHPTFARDLAKAVRRLVADRRCGIYHATNQGVTTWFEFARAVFDSAGFDAERIEPIPTSELRPARPAPRPTNSVLDNAVMRLEGLPLLPHYRPSLDLLVAELLR
jgi:dTDP-4-dehydrorhamnose reductase